MFHANTKTRHVEVILLSVVPTQIKRGLLVVIQSIFEYMNNEMMVN